MTFLDSMKIFFEKKDFLKKEDFYFPLMVKLWLQKK